MKFKKLVSLLLVIIFTISISSFASANNINISQDSNHILLKQEEINSALISAADDNITLKSQEIIIPSSSNNKERASILKVGLGYGRDILGEFIEIRVDGISTSLVNIELDLTVWHAPGDGNGYFTYNKVCFYSGGLVNEKTKRIRFNDWSTAGIQGYANYSSGIQKNIEFTMIKNPTNSK